MQNFDHKALHEHLESFSISTDIPVTLYTPEGAILEELLPEKKFCQYFNTWNTPGECTKILRFSTQMSFDTGEPYIYYCPVGLVHIAVPIIFEQQYCACAVAGPLVMGEIEEKYLQQALSLDPGAKETIVEIALFISKCRVYTPIQIQKLSLLLYSAVLHSTRNLKDYEFQSSRHNRTLEMGAHILQRKKEGITAPPSSLPPTITELEARLIQDLKSHSKTDAKASLDALIGELILIEGGNFDGLKLRVFELYVNLSRIASEEGIGLKQIFGSDFALINKLNQVETVEQFSHWSADFVAHFVDKVFTHIPAVSGTIANAVSYIAAHYMEKITLRDLAGQLFLSESHLSKLFRQELDTSFTDYLNRTRIDHSIDLMRTTDLSLLEISGMVGFEDQSYFTKVFKRATGETPRRYRLLLKEGSHD